MRSCYSEFGRHWPICVAKDLLLKYRIALKPRVADPGFFLNGGIRVHFLLENFLDSYIERKKLRMNCIRFKFDPNPCYFSKAFSGFVFFFMAGPGSGFFLKVGSGLFGSESAPAHTNHSCDVKPFFSVYTHWVREAAKKYSFFSGPATKMGLGGGIKALVVGPIKFCGFPYSD